MSLSNTQILKNELKYSEKSGSESWSTVEKQWRKIESNVMNIYDNKTLIFYTVCGVTLAFHTVQMLHNIQS